MKRNSKSEILGKNAFIYVFFSRLELCFEIIFILCSAVFKLLSPAKDSKFAGVADKSGLNTVSFLVYDSTQEAIPM